MFTHIMVPVDLAHVGALERALACAADLARHWGARVTYVGVSGAAPGPLGHTPAEKAQRLADFAAAQGQAQGITTDAHAMSTHDPATDLEKALLAALDETGADLVVMASHVPGLADHIWPSNGGRIAGHARASVMVLRN